MILATARGNTELRFGESQARIPSWGSLSTSAAGQTVNAASAGGLPAVGRAIRLVAGTVAALPLRVVKGYGADKQENDGDWRAELLEEPVYGVSDFDWRWDIVSSLEASENAFLLKRKSNGRVVELEHVPHYAVTARLSRRGEKEFDVDFGTGRRTLTTDDILHIRGNTVGGGPFGVSRFHQHRDPLGAMLAAQRFEGAYFRNHARPDLAVIFPQGVSRDQAAEWKPEWDSKYAGAENAGNVIPLGGGATIVPIPLNMRDAQFIEARQMGVEDVGRIMDIDASLLGAETRTDTRKTALDLFLRLQMPPRLRRITCALRADPDLFGGSEMYPEFVVDDMMFADPLTRAEVEHYQIQDGTLLVDEARARRGQPALPPIPEDPSQEPGKVPQITPVGGAPNPAADVSSDSSDREGGLTLPSIELRVEQDMSPIGEAIGEAVAGQVAAHRELVSVLQQDVTDRSHRDAAREKRHMDREDAAEVRRAALEQAHTEALRAVGQPNITVNVEPTPVTIENTFSPQPIPVQLTMLDEPDAPMDVTFTRNPNGSIKSARITEEN